MDDLDIGFHSGGGDDDLDMNFFSGSSPSPAPVKPKKAPIATKTAVRKIAEVRKELKVKVEEVKVKEEKEVEEVKEKGVVDAARLNSAKRERQDLVRKSLGRSNEAKSKVADNEVKLEPPNEKSNGAKIEEQEEQDEGWESKKSNKKKHKVLSIEDDPMQYHAKPRDLAGASMPDTDITDGRYGDKSQLSQYIFSKMPFADLGLDSRLVDHLNKSVADGGLGLQTSTLVQSTVVPLMTDRLAKAKTKKEKEKERDLKEKSAPTSSTGYIGSTNSVLFKSQTGSGKTIAFLLPVLHDLMQTKPAVKREDGTRAVIISPTRELCSQIAGVLSKLTHCCVNLVSGSIVGGEKKKSEKARLRKGVVILVATPGRLLDHMRTTESFNLQPLKFLVLDEADRLLDMGFEKDILEIVALIRGTTVLQGLGKDKDNKSKESLTLTKKWSQQQAMAAKKCKYPSKLVHLMASATITHSLRKLAVPIMGGKSFYYVDADNEVLDVVTSESVFDEVAQRGKKKKTKVGTVTGVGVGEKDSGKRAEKRSREGDTDEDEDKDEDGDDNGNVSVSDESDSDSDGVGNGKSEAAEGSKSSRSSRSGGSHLEAGEAMDAPRQLQQYYMTVSCKWRLAALASFLRTHSHQKLMVFLSTCDSVDYHSLLLREAQWPISLDADAVEDMELSEKEREKEKEKKRKQELDPLATNGETRGLLGKSCPIFRLHGNVPQKARQSIFQEFSAAKSGVLLCTDVAARGLDLPSIDWILQYDPPCETTDYVHRCGRTARRGKGGNALLFVLPSETEYVKLLQSHGLQPEALSLQSLFKSATVHVPGAAKFKNEEEMAAVILQRRFERTVDGIQPLLLAARQAFRSHVRAYATHSADTKGIFRVHSLHLGHVAKSFALKESPKTLSSGAGEDVLGKIFNGIYAVKVDVAAFGNSGRGEVGSAQHIANDKAAKLARKRARNEKYSLSRGGNTKNVEEAAAAGMAGGAGLSAGSQAQAQANLSARDKKKLKLKHKVANVRDKQKLRPISSGGAARNRPSAGTAMISKGKKGGGLSKKRIKDQSLSEFTA